jgi:hypothetical protein
MAHIPIPPTLEKATERLDCPRSGQKTSISWTNSRQDLKHYLETARVVWKIQNELRRVCRNDITSFIARTVQSVLDHHSTDTYR